ncbi:hypothetical protein PM3016_4576 [Paenibacillus mucilaginosus 3016]|uniref:Uncharacterized protein n=1 Tax=Paenibacillus mucilaginosus 3016 TaxID=1116391 RepID=H6NDI6_9BACL|nr:hypothetical protein PM3016_4576 [Paenibacillus mucilaginosus 3016]
MRRSERAGVQGMGKRMMKGAAWLLASTAAMLLVTAWMDWYMTLAAGALLALVRRSRPSGLARLRERRDRLDRSRPLPGGPYGALRLHGADRRSLRAERHGRLRRRPAASLRAWGAAGRRRQLAGPPGGRAVGAAAAGSSPAAAASCGAGREAAAEGNRVETITD